MTGPVIISSLIPFEWGVTPKAARKLRVAESIGLLKVRDQVLIPRKA
jgi:hypothetical protein